MRSGSRSRPTVWALAASVAGVALVGWVAFQQYGGAPEAAAVATARQVQDIRTTQIRRQPSLGEYLTVHQEYAPVSAMERTLPNPRRAPSVEQDRR